MAQWVCFEGRRLRYLPLPARGPAAAKVVVWTYAATGSLTRQEYMRKLCGSYHVDVDRWGCCLQGFCRRPRARSCRYLWDLSLGAHTRQTLSCFKRHSCTVLLTFDTRGGLVGLCVEGENPACPRRTGHVCKGVIPISKQPRITTTIHDQMSRDARACGYRTEMHLATM